MLFKFIDASENLSIQLHHNDELARERYDLYGKTEMWYVLDNDSKIYAGLNKTLSKKEYLSFNEKGNLLGVVCLESVKKMMFFLLN